MIFSFLFSPCFFSLCLLSLCLFTLSFVSSVCVQSFFFWRNLFFDSPSFCSCCCFIIIFFIFSSLFVKTIFCSISFCVSHCFFFNLVLSNKRNWLFFWLKKPLFLTTPRIYFLNVCYLTSKRKKSSFIIFRQANLFEIPFSKKRRKFLSFLENSIFPLFFFVFFLGWKKLFPQKLLWQQNIRLSSFFRKDCFYHLLVVFFIWNFLFAKFSFEKNGFLEKNFFYLLLIFF